MPERPDAVRGVRLAVLATGLRQALQTLPVPDAVFEVARAAEIRRFVSLALAIQIGFALTGALTDQLAALAPDRPTAALAGTGFALVSIALLILVRRAGSAAAQERLAFLTAAVAFTECSVGQVLNPGTAAAVTAYQAIAVGVIAYGLRWRPRTHYLFLVVALVVALGGLTAVRPPELQVAMVGALAFAWIVAVVTKPRLWNDRVVRYEDALRVRRAHDELEEAQRLARVGSWRLAWPGPRIELSREMGSILGLPADVPVETAAVAALIPVPIRSVLASAVCAARDDGRPFLIEISVPLHGGAERVLVVAGERVLDAGDDPAHARSSVRGSALDVTDLRRAQQQAARAERAEMAAALAAGVALDVGNVLSAVNGYTHLLLSDLPASSPARSDALGIREAVDRAAPLVRRLLAFARFRVPSPQVVDARTLVGGLEPLLRGACGPGIDLRIVLAGEPCWVLADPGLLEQALTNLALNARDAMARGGRLDIVVETDPAAGEVRIAVSDTGPGIDAADLPHVLEPYYATRAHGDGSGLGLASVEWAVVRSGGTVEVDSRRGAGSRFTICMPRAVTDLPKAVPAAEATPDRGGGETILVVEDDTAVRLLVVRTLQRLGYAVVDADGPEHARVLVDNSLPRLDLLLADVRMSGETGIQLAAAVVARRPGIAVVFMTGDPNARRAAGAKGAIVLEKPFTADGLASAVRAALDARAARAESLRP